jgi:phage host-nuclease inhibitor protein Gam
MTENVSLTEIAILNPRNEPTVPNEFHVHDDDSANWVIRKITEARAYSKRCAEWCDREQARAKREEEFFMFRFGQQLFQFARQKISEAGGRRKSVGLPAGTVGFRSEPAKLVVDDEAAVIAWAKQFVPELVGTVERLSKSGLNDHLEQTGEIPDAGVHIEPARERFYVK